MGDRRAQVVLVWSRRRRVRRGHGRNGAGGRATPARLDDPRSDRHSRLRARPAHPRNGPRGSRVGNALRDALHRRARTAGEHAGRARRRLPDRAEATWPGTDPPRHALARPDGARLRAHVCSRARAGGFRRGAVGEANDSELDCRVCRRHPGVPADDATGGAEDRRGRRGARRDLPDQVLRRAGTGRGDRPCDPGARRPRPHRRHAAGTHVADGARRAGLRRPGRGAQGGRRASHPSFLRGGGRLALHVTLEGRRVRLEPLEPRHEEALWAIAQDPRVWTLMRVRGHESREAFQAWFESIETGFAHYFDGELVGHTSFLNDRPADRVVEIGNTWLRTEAWGTGANTEAKYLLMRHAFEDEGYLRVEFKTDATNGRARAALAALPSEFEGVFRKHMLVRGGERRDSAWYAVIDDDWPAVKASLERRLDPA